MDKPARFPFLSEESIRKQNVDVYLADLKSRMKTLRNLHNEVFQNSVEIINEIDGVSTSLLSQETSNAHNLRACKSGGSRIKQLIQEFEKTKVTVKAETKDEANIEVNVDISKILKNFEELNKSHVLKESLVLFKQAKDSFEKIDTLLENVTESTNEDDDADCEVGAQKELNANICYMRRQSPMREDRHSNYGSCSSSLLSVAMFQSTEDIPNIVEITPSTTTSLERGYDGDNDDSEYDLIAKKKKKFP